MKSTMGRSGALLAVAIAGAALSGCASAFVSGGVASASMEDGRVAIDSRTARASVGPAGPEADARRSRTAICIDGATGAAVSC